LPCLLVGIFPMPGRVEGEGVPVSEVVHHDGKAGRTAPPAAPDTDLLALAPAAATPPPAAEKGPDRPAVASDETVIEAWARALTRNALEALGADAARTVLGTARGLVFIVPEKLGTLLGVHAGSALGFLKKSDGNWGLPVIYQLESEVPFRWGGALLLILPIEDEKTQLSMILPQWSHSLSPPETPPNPVLPEKNPVLPENPSTPPGAKEEAGYSPWTFPPTEDFPKKLKLRFHFSREINEEVYGKKDVRALDICFDDAGAPPCLRELWSFLQKTLS